jgi:hypothetical protein
MSLLQFGAHMQQRKNIGKKTCSNSRKPYTISHVFPQQNSQAVITKIMNRMQYPFFFTKTLVLP